MFILRWLVGYMRLLHRRWAFLAKHDEAQDPEEYGQRSLVHRVTELFIGDWYRCIRDDCRFLEVMKPLVLGNWRNLDLRYCKSFPGSFHLLEGKESAASKQVRTRYT